MSDHAEAIRKPATARSVDRDDGSPPSTQHDAVAQRLNRRPAVVAQRAAADRLAARPNRTGLPDALKSGIETLSGLSMDDVRVHRNSAKPAQLQAHAYAQGTDIHLAPGQERHLPHEAWHVVQQKQGRVRETMQMKGVGVNAEPGLETEADRMGGLAASLRRPAHRRDVQPVTRPGITPPGDVAQCILIKVTTQRLAADQPRIISAIAFAERVPTVVTSGQGDHTVAEALVELALERHCLGKSHVQVSQSFPSMLRLLDTEISARYLGPDRKFQAIDAAGIMTLIQRYHAQALAGAEGEDLNELLSEIVEMFLRVWNKRMGSAYLRKDGMTTGGGGGTEERMAKKDLNEIADRNDLDDDHEDDGLEWKLTAARALTRLIDFNAAKNFEEAVGHIVTAIELAVESLPDGDMHYEHIGTLAVQLYARQHGMSRELEEKLDRLVFRELNGETYEDFEEDSQSSPGGASATGGGDGSTMTD